jgi:hypothetical protein
VKVAPLKTRVPGPRSEAGEAMAWGPAPLSAVNVMPVSVFEATDVILFVMLTFRNMYKSTFRVELGAPPEQVNTRLLVSSVIPSPRTMGGAAEGVQVKGAACANEDTPATLRSKTGKNWRNMGKYLGCSLSEEFGPVYAPLQ